MSHIQDLQALRPQDLSGVLVVDKTAGPTSHDIVTLARRALGESRIGHTGTLDPMATGVLPLVIGRATRLAQFLTASDKSYEASIAFGRTTNTYDASGKTTDSAEHRPNRDQLAAALERFRGTFEQTPPAYSAKNIDGERSYELARKGKTATPQRPTAVTVTVKRLELRSFDGETASLDLQVTAGFYVRSLAHDLGEALGCGAHLSALLSDVAAVTLRGAANLERLKNGVEMGPGDLVAPLATPPPMVRLLGPDGNLVGLAKPSKTMGNLHGWVVLL